MRDVNPTRVIWHQEKPVARLCDTDSAGGGYDKFSEYTGERWQFIAQVRGCNLDCTYCYVTDEGIWGQPVFIDSETLAELCEVKVFHLMGGAPARYMRFWPDLACRVEIFHSDLLLTEGKYDIGILKDLPNAVLAVSIKGENESQYEAFTRRKLNWDRFWRNLDIVKASGVDHYFTFTGFQPSQPFLERLGADRWFHIPIRWDLEALNP